MMTLLLPGGSLRRVLAEDDDRLGSRRRSLGGSRVVAAGIFTCRRRERREGLGLSGSLSVCVRVGVCGCIPACMFLYMQVGIYV